MMVRPSVVAAYWPMVSGKLKKGGSPKRPPNRLVPEQAGSARQHIGQAAQRDLTRLHFEPVIAEAASRRVDPGEVALEPEVLREAVAERSCECQLRIA